MSFLAEISPLYVASGFCVGLLVGLTGVGGGSLMTPILILIFGVAPGAAVGTDLLYACVTKSGGVLVHGLNHTVDWRVVRRLSLGSLPASVVTLSVLYSLNIHSAASNTLFVLALGVALLLTASALVFRRRFTEFYMSRVGVLPAFGSFTGLATVPARFGDRVFVCAETEVIELPGGSQAT